MNIFCREYDVLFSVYRRSSIIRNHWINHKIFLKKNQTITTKRHENFEVALQFCESRWHKFFGSMYDEFLSIVNSFFLLYQLDIS